MKVHFLAFPFLLLACGGSTQTGAAAPDRCAADCEVQGQTCENACTAEKADGRNACLDHCSDARARCTSACR